MTRYCVVPVEPTEEMIRASIQLERTCNAGGYTPQISEEWKWMLAARPPLDAEMQAAVELARRIIEYRGTIKYENDVILSRALLRAVGEKE